MTDKTPTAGDRPDQNWQDPSLAGLRALEISSMPAFEVLFLDDLAAYVMGAGELTQPYTVEHGSRVVSALFAAVINSGRFEPEREPEATEPMASIRESFVVGAHAFADKGPTGLAQLVNRVVPAVLGELEIHKDDPGAQTRSLFYYTLLAVASGPLNLLSEYAASGAIEVFVGWDELFGDGLMLPWRKQVSPR